MNEDKETPEKGKKTGHLLEKTIMGAIIGAAIGSVVGATIAPEKGKKTRKEIKEAAVKVGGAAKQAFIKSAEAGKEVSKSAIRSKIFQKIKSWIFREKKKIPHEIE